MSLQLEMVEATILVQLTATPTASTPSQLALLAAMEGSPVSMSCALVRWWSHLTVILTKTSAMW